MKESTFFFSFSSQLRIREKYNALQLILTVQCSLLEGVRRKINPLFNPKSLKHKLYAPLACQCCFFQHLALPTSVTSRAHQLKQQLVNRDACLFETPLPVPPFCSVSPLKCTASHIICVIFALKIL